MADSVSRCGENVEKPSASALHFKAARGLQAPKGWPWRICRESIVPFHDSERCLADFQSHSLDSERCMGDFSLLRLSHDSGRRCEIWCMSGCEGCREGFPRVTDELAEKFSCW